MHVFPHTHPAITTQLTWLTSCLPSPQRNSAKKTSSFGLRSSGRKKRYPACSGTEPRASGRVRLANRSPTWLRQTDELRAQLAASALAADAPTPIAVEEKRPKECGKSKRERIKSSVDPREVHTAATKALQVGSVLHECTKIPELGSF